MAEISLGFTQGAIYGRMMTGLSPVLREATAALEGISPTPRLDAELLLAHALGLDRSAMLLRQHDLTAPESFTDLLARRDKINQTLQEIIDRHTDPWGVKVTAVEVRDVTLPDDMKRTMARQAESERERRSKIIHAEGEFQAAERMVQAAAMISREPIALQLRYLQTMREISSEQNTTTFLPIPLEIFAPFLRGGAPKP